MEAEDPLNGNRQTLRGALGGSPVKLLGQEQTERLAGGEDDFEPSQGCQSKSCIWPLGS